MYDAGGRNHKRIIILYSGKFSAKHYIRVKRIPDNLLCPGLHNDSRQTYFQRRHKAIGMAWDCDGIYGCGNGCDDNHIILADIRSIIANLLFLSVGASFLCYLMWNTAVKHLGAERTSNYIYLVPLVTILASTIILDEPFTLIMAVGTAMIIGGVILSTKS